MSVVVAEHKSGMSGLFSRFRKKKKDGSEDESEQTQSHHSHHGHHHGHHKSHSRKDTDNYVQLLADAKEAFMDIFHMDGWKHEGGKNLDEGMIYSQTIKKFGRKIFKLRGIVNMAPGDLWEDMVHTLNDSPKWNPTILESRTLIVVDDNTEVMYNISAESAGGLISARDFTTIRRWLKINDNMHVAVSVSCQVADMPPSKKYVRGDNGPGGWIFEPVENEPDKCLFTWIVNTNLKGWLPQTAIDQAMSYVLSSYFKLLLGHYEEIIEQRRQQT